VTRGTADAAGDLAARVAGGLTGADGVVGVGIDAVDIPRFRRVLARRPTLARRLFTPGERAYADLVPDPVPRLATRFATKEAVLKALGLGLGAFGFHDVEVERDGTGPPTLVLHADAAAAAREAGATRWHLSLTHTDLVALSAVVAAGTDGAGGMAPPGPADR
jgi:holo-[acyl-carrier protein] synthase